jgi:hypothetical protein
MVNPVKVPVFKTVDPEPDNTHFPVPNAIDRVLELDETSVVEVKVREFRFTVPWVWVNDPTCV